ncbi:hypothetical protein G6F68_015431 [Rhizopus microsporus]|nr:hypothetical protein G6F68_015431 [Rhizopus microsporus]
MLARQRYGFHHGAFRRQHARAGGDVAAGLDHAIIAQRDAQARVGAQQAALADGHHLFATAGHGAHDGGAAADVGAVIDDDARADAAFDHRRAERAGVEVAEPFVQHGGACRQVCAQPHARGVRDAHAAGHDVVGQAGNPVDAADLVGRADGAQLPAQGVDLGSGAGPDGAAG